MRDRTRFRALVWLALALAFVLRTGDLLAASGSLDGGPPDASVAADAAVLGDPVAAVLRRDASNVRALLDGNLSVVVAPSSLFDVRLDDNAELDLEAARLTALLRDIDSPRARTTKSAARSARWVAQGGDAGADAGREVGEEVWNARVDLDRARLAFYVLPASARQALLTSDAERKAAIVLVESEAEHRAREADAAHQAALQAARDAQSEGERAVAQELARLLEVKRAQVEFREQLATLRRETANRREETLGWQRKAREARAGSIDGNDPADDLYENLRRALRGARDALSSAMEELSATSRVPRSEPSTLSGLPDDIDVSGVRAEREGVDAEARRLVTDEAKVRVERASQLFEEVDSLNVERLGLLPSLSSAKRSAITGFTTIGWDQASAEVRQLSLILRYHRHALARWVGSLSTSERDIGRLFTMSAFAMVEWLVAIMLFFAWRKRAPLLLGALLERVRQRDRLERLTAPSVAERVLEFLRAIRSPLEWLVLLLLLAWLLPASVKNVLEVELAFVILTWSVGAALVVDIVNALSGGAPRPHDAGGVDASALRLRSLRLVSRVFVVFALILVISARLVGRGTIYEWVLSTCWVASIPIALVLVRWWRETVFRRIAAVRKKSPFEQWVLANRDGWKSFLAATSGGVYLFVTGGVRGVRAWVGRFDVTRRVLAYLFRRELDKLGAERPNLEIAPLPEPVFDALGPEARSAEWVPTDVDERLDALIKRIRDHRGGVIALVGERGLGKSAALRHLETQTGSAVLFDLPKGGIADLQKLLVSRLELDPEAPLESAARHLADSATIHAVLVDNVHRFVKPVMGGLATFDELLATASRNSAVTTWVFAIDDVVWQFLERARGGRPLFDDILKLPRWREGEIVQLLRARTAEASLAPSFEQLIDRLPANADEIDKQQALEKRAASYYQLIWDYASGNPGVALHMWRRSLGIDAEGVVRVRLFQALDTSDFHRLPDAAVFVLRAVLQLAPATASEIGKATMLRAADVADALRYAYARGYVEEVAGAYRVTWTWYRAMTLFLQRRHLLAAS